MLSVLVSCPFDPLVPMKKAIQVAIAILATHVQFNGTSTFTYINV